MPSAEPGRGLLPPGGGDSVDNRSRLLVMGYAFTLMRGSR
jgi:hypothetical protein